MTAILLVFQADSQHEKITDVYMGLVVCRVESRLYAPDQILDFIKDIEVDLQAAHDTLKPQNHCSLLIDSMMREPYPMEMVGDFWVVDLIFKGCYGDLLLYSDTDLHWLRWQRIHLPMFQGEIPMPPAPFYRQVRKPVVTKQSPHRVVASDTPVESPKAKCPSSKSSPQEAWDAAPRPQLQSAPTLLQPRSPPAPKSQPQMARRSLQRLTVLASVVVHLLPPPGQLEANKEIFMWKTLVWLTPLFPSAPACLMASTVQWVPSAT